MQYNTVKGVYVDTLDRGSKIEMIRIADAIDGN